MNEQQSRSSSPVLVTGATGQIGTLVVRGLLARGVRVRALARDVGRAVDLADTGAEIVAGDLARPETLEAALDGVERAFLLSPSAPDQVELQSTFVRAAKQAGLGLLVKLSGAHANPDAGPRFARWHGQVERAIVEADLPHTFVQPVYFMQNVPSQIRSAGGRFFTPVPADLPVSLVDLRDIAAVAVAALTAVRHVNQTYVVTGPALISHAQMAGIVSEVTGAEVHYAEVDVQRFVEVLLQAGQPEWLARGVAELFLHMDSDVTDAVATLVGREPIGFEQFAREHADAFGLPIPVSPP